MTHARYSTPLRSSFAVPVNTYYGAIVRQSIAMMRARPSLRYAILYLTVVPLAAVIMETFFLQPQAIQLGVPIAGVGIVVMALQIANMAGSAGSQRIVARSSEGRVIYAAPGLIVCSLILLAALQTVPALLFIAIIGLLTAVLRPLMMSRIQVEVPAAIRATILSMQSLMFTLLLTLGEPILGTIADHAGLPAAYVALAGGLSILVAFLLWRGRANFPAATPSTASDLTATSG
jgi:predicted MFS family arabinose efflux permease